MRSSHFLIAALIIVTALALLPSSLWSAATQPGAIVLRMVVWGMPFEDRLYRDIFARGFERLPAQRARHVVVRYDRYTDVIPKYQAWHDINEGADVMRLPVTDYYQMIGEGIIEPLDRWINDPDPDIGLTPEQQADYFPSIWDQLEVDGHRYALPSDNAQYGLYYNKSIFDNYNRQHPDAPLSYPDRTWTWSDLKYAEEKLTVRDEASGRTGQYGLMFEVWAWPFEAFFATAGGKLWDTEQTTTLINSDAGVEALTFMISLLPSDAPIRSQDLASSAAGPDVLFKTGQLAMLLDGSWRAPNLELSNPDLDYAVAPFPAYKKRITLSGSVLWAMSVHSRHKAVAWQMIKWLTMPEQSLEYWNMLRVAPPANISVVTGTAFRQTTGLFDPETGRVIVPPLTPDHFADRAQWLLDAVTPDPVTGLMPGWVPVAPYQADLEAHISAALVAAIRGDKTPRQAMDDAAAEVDAIIDRDRASKGLPPVDRRPTH